MSNILQPPRLPNSMNAKELWPKTNQTEVRAKNASGEEVHNPWVVEEQFFPRKTPRLRARTCQKPTPLPASYLPFVMALLKAKAKHD